MGIQRARPSSEILSGDSADVYFARADSILAAEGLDPIVTMEVFCRQDAVLCGIDEAKNLLGHVLAECDPTETSVEALDDGDRITPRDEPPHGMLGGDAWEGSVLLDPGDLVLLGTATSFSTT